MSAVIKTIEPIPVIGIEHKGAYDKIGDKFGELFGMAASKGWPVQGMLGIYYDDPRDTPEADLRSKACAIVPSGFDPGADGVEAFVVEGGDYAVMRHVGSYSKLGDAWMALYSQELPKLGMEDAGPPFEMYMNNPRETPEDDLITDLHVPVKPR